VKVSRDFYKKITKKIKKLTKKQIEKISNSTLPGNGDITQSD